MELVATQEDREAQIHLERTDQGYRLTVDGKTYDVDVMHVGDGVRSLLIGKRQFLVSARSQGNGRYRVGHMAGSDDVELMDPLARLARDAHGSGRSGTGQVKAYMPGRVVRILVEEGQEVEQGQGVVVLEAMKMENEIQAENAGTLRKILVDEGQAVEGGDVLFEIE